MTHLPLVKSQDQLVTKKCRPLNTATESSDATNARLPGNRARDQPAVAQSSGKNPSCHGKTHCFADLLNQPSPQWILPLAGFFPYRECVAPCVSVHTSGHNTNTAALERLRIRSRSWNLFLLPFDVPTVNPNPPNQFDQVK